MRRIWCAFFLSCIGLLAQGCSQKNGKFLERGKEYLDKKDFARAVLEFKNEARVVPKSPEPYYYMGLAYVGTHDVRSAYTSFKKAIELDPSHVPSQIKLAEMMALSPDKRVREEAMAHAKTVLAKTPDDADALTAVALAEYRDGEQKAAPDRLRQTDDRLRAIVENAPQHVKSAIILSALKIAQRDIRGAEQVLKSAVQNNPQSSEAAVALGRFYFSNQQLPQAEESLQQAVRIAPYDSAALHDLARVQLRMGKKDIAEQNIKRLAALPDKQYRAVHATFLLASGKRDVAIKELEDIHGKDPANRDIRSYLMTLYLQSGRAADAERALGNALKENAKDVEALLYRADLRVARGQYTEAQTDINEVLRIQPDSAQAHLIMAGIHGANGRTLNERQELAEAVRLRPDLLSARIKLAESLILSRDGKSALELMNQAPQSSKRTLPWIVQRNRALLVLEDKAALRKGIDEGLAVGRSRDLLLQDAVLRQLEKDYKGARSAAEEILAKDPEDIQALERVTATYMAENKPEAALERMRQQIARTPNSATVRHLLATRLRAIGNTKEARSVLEATLNTNTNFVPARIELARLDLAEGRFDAVRKTASDLLNSVSTEITGRLLLAEAERRTGNYSASIDHYRRVLNRDSNNILALNNLAYLLIEHGNGIDEGLKYAQQVKELAPNTATVDDTIGWAFYRKGIYRTAVQYLEAAASKETSATPKYHLGMAYYKLGEAAKGKAMIEAALRQNPTLPEAAAAQQVLSAR